MMKEILDQQQIILDKLKIEQLNPMQKDAQKAIATGNDLIVLSPTGTGKTVAFLLPIFARIDWKSDQVQAIVVVPSRELAIQIEQVARKMGTGYKINSVYGGRAGSQDKIDLNHRPALLIGTPGRINDHLRKGSFSTDHIKILVLDEFDKSLEIGFEIEMSSIIDTLPNVQQRILTSATEMNQIPAFIGLKKPIIINYLHEKIEALSVKVVQSPRHEKFDILATTLSYIGHQPGIIFCNFRESIDKVSQFLESKNYAHGCYHGAMEQRDREIELLKFRNGTHQLIVATDLAARGLDIPELKFIIHFEMPSKAREFIHRNGRTARMKQDGTAYVLKGLHEDLPEFIDHPEFVQLSPKHTPQATEWSTLYITAGRRDKISKGDIAGLLQKQGELTPSDLGVIEITQEGSYVAVKTSQVARVLGLINNSKLKKIKIRIKVLE